MNAKEISYVMKMNAYIHPHVCFSFYFNVNKEKVILPS